MVSSADYDPNPSPWMSQEISAFSPSAPIDTVSLFRGRSLQMRILTETVKQIGQHAIIYGERGVGKTSLVSVLFKVVGDAVRTRTTFARVNCDVEDTFESLWRKVFRELPLNERGQVMEVQRGFNEPTATLADRLGDNVSPDDIRRLSAAVDGHLIVIIDEFDQMTGNQEAVRLVANTIKTLSDRRAPVTLILVGVADTVSQLISEHESVERNLVQVRMPRMSDDEIAQIIFKGLTSINVSIDPEQLNYVCSLCHGLPVAAHRIGLQLAFRMLESGQSRVSRADVANAMDDVVDRMPESHSLDWRDAIDSSASGTLYEKVLIAAALAPRGEQGWFQPSDLQEALQVVTGDYGQRKGASYSQHLHRFATQRGVVLDRSGSKGRWQFRFRNPSFQSYVLMRALSSGSISESVVAKFRPNLPAESAFA